MSAPSTTQRTAVGYEAASTMTPSGASQATPRRNTAGEEAAAAAAAAAATPDRFEDSASRPRGASSGSLPHNGISTTPKKAGGLLSGLRNPMVVYAAMKASSDGEGSSSNRDGSSEGGASPSDECEARTRLLAKIEGAKQRLVQINYQRERDLDEFISMAEKVEAAGGRDTPAIARIKQHYDRKNKKSSGQIDEVQKKLASYEARLADLDGGGSGAADPLRGHNVLSTVGQGIRRTGANLKSMTSTVVSAPLELAQKLKRGTMGSSSDPIEGELGQSQFYPNALASRSASGLSVGGGPSQTASTTGSGAGAGKQKASTLPANMRMSPVDLEAAVAAAGLSTGVPSTSGSGTSSVEWPKRSSQKGGRDRNDDKAPAAEPTKSSSEGEDSLARLPQLGTLMAERQLQLQQLQHGQQQQPRGGGGGGEGRSSVTADIVPFVMVPRTSLTGGSSVMSSEEIASMFTEMRQMRQHNMTIVEHLDKLQDKVQHELSRQEKLLTEERFKNQKLEDTINEFIELYQAETTTLKNDVQMIASRVTYQYNDRFKKVEENLESTQNHMFRVENSLRASLEIKEGGPWFNAMVLSGATILVELLKIGLYLTAVVLDFFRPFTGTRTKAGFFLFILFLSFIILQNAQWIFGLFAGSPSSAGPANLSSSVINATNSAAPAASAAAAAGQAPPPPTGPPTL